MKRGPLRKAGPISCILLAFCLEVIIVILLLISFNSRKQRNFFIVLKCSSSELRKMSRSLFILTLQTLAYGLVWKKLAGTGLHVRTTTLSETILLWGVEW